MENLTFEQKLTRLNEIVSQIDNNKLGLEESLKVYEEGMTLIKELEGTLNAANEKFLKIKDSGELIEEVLK